MKLGGETIHASPRNEEFKGEKGAVHLSFQLRLSLPRGKKCSSLSEAFLEDMFPGNSRFDGCEIHKAFLLVSGKLKPSSCGAVLS